jgi:DNA-binding transcriptional regulator GbsR (MarR family)
MNCREIEWGEMETAEELKAKIEGFLVLFEGMGFPPIASKIMAYLMYTEPPQQSFYNIQEFLGVSKGAVSQNLTLLQSMGFVDFVRVTGDRKRYFRMNPASWVSIVEREFFGMEKFRQVFEDLTEVRAEKHPELSAQWHEVTELYRLLERKLPLILQEWRESRAAAHPELMEEATHPPAEEGEDS